MVPSRSDFSDFPELDFPFKVPTWAIEITFNRRQVLVGGDYLHSQENAWADAVRRWKEGLPEASGAR